MDYHHSLEIANYFIRRAWDVGDEITPMKLLKLIYIAQGWHLALTYEPLIGEPFLACKFGPIAKKAFDRFSRFGRLPINTMAGYRTTEGLHKYYDLEDPETRVFLERIWEVYGPYDGLQLSALTHEPGSPWDVIWNNRENGTYPEIPIPNDMIQQYYRNLANVNRERKSREQPAIWS